MAAIWLAHPLQSESVTYVVQRVESLAGRGFLLTLYAEIRAWDASGLPLSLRPRAHRSATTRVRGRWLAASPSA